MKRIYYILIAVCLILSAFLVLTSCGENPPAPQKLTAPTVTLTDNVASWSADSSADKFEISLDGNLSYVENTVTSKVLTNGQTLKVRAIGDGEAFSTSDWSNSVTYTEGAEAPDPGPAPQPTKLGTPAVSISESGLASWSAIANASGYIYKINGGTEVSTSATSIQLADGQSITVKAVGDGESFLDSDFSTVKVYTQGSPDPGPSPEPPSTDAPAYLGILASNSEPTQAGGLPEGIRPSARMLSSRMMTRINYRSFDSALNEYFENSANHFNAPLPEASVYDAYARPGETVYIQIWLDNPNQYTILSLKLNGTKYQVGGGLSSFFISDGVQHYNCIYVAVELPAGAYAEKTYTVSDIEYISNTFINADGTDEFMNNNDTVSIGLPYNATNPEVTDFNPTSVTVNSLNLTLNLSDASGLAALSGGWLGVSIFNGESIISNSALTLGTNTVSASGLVENTYYWVYVYIYADLHDGKGVSTHIIYENSIRTPEAIHVDKMEGAILYDSAKDGYHGAVVVKSTLNSATAEYIKLEVIFNGEVIYTDNSYNGTATISEGILCGSSYDVRIYYKDTEYPDGKYVEDYVWVSYLGDPWYQNNGFYSFVNDGVFYFELNNNDESYPAIEELTVKLYDEESPRWVAEDVLYILQNPNAIEDTRAEIDALYVQFNEAYGNHELMNQIHNQISELEESLRPLEKALWYLENRADNNRDIAYWESEAAKGKYFYDFNYNGVDGEYIFKVGKTYYVVLDGIFNIDTSRLKAEITYSYDKREGDGVTENTISEYVNVTKAYTDHWVLIENVSYSDGRLTLTLYNEPDWGSEVRPPLGIGYVYKVEVDGKVVYLDETYHESDIDEEAWFNAYIERIKAGEDVEGLMDEFVPDYAPSYTVNIDASELSAGDYYFNIYIRLVDTEYEDDDYHARRGSDRITVYERLEKPTIEFRENFGEYYGIVIPDYIHNWYGTYEFEAIDKDGGSVEISLSSESNRGSFTLPAPGTKIRARLTRDGCWLESEWSEWYTYEGNKLPAPEFGEYNMSTCKIGWYARLDYVSHFIYTINDGEEVRVERDASINIMLNNGDVLRVKCVASEEGRGLGYIDSDIAEYVCTDTRPTLSTPENVKYQGGRISWDEVDGADYYVIEYVYKDGRTSSRRVEATSASAPSGAISFRVYAASENIEAYRHSAYSESVLISNEGKNG